MSDAQVPNSPNRRCSVTGWLTGTALTALLALVMAVLMIWSNAAVAQSASIGATGIKTRNVGVSRTRAAALPRSEADQALVDRWPLYRTERAQEAFNDAMATLAATAGPPPTPATFAACPRLECALRLPAIAGDGWIPAGRLWSSPTEYVLVVHSPRLRTGQSYRRRTVMDMKVFVYHEFLNSSRNTDVFDTISSHKGYVFVPLYMSKQETDAKGHHFVTVVQVAPVDVVSIHASNYGSAGPGIEVAKNSSDALEPLQATAGALIGTMVKSTIPRLRVVNHHGNEGLPMLASYEQRLAAVSTRPTSNKVLALPFVAAAPQRMAAVTDPLENLITRRGLSPRIPIAQRGFLPPAATLVARTSADTQPVLLEAPKLEPRPASAPTLLEPARAAPRPWHRFNQPS